MHVDISPAVTNPVSLLIDQHRLGDLDLFKLDLAYIGQACWLEAQGGDRYQCPANFTLHAQILAL